LIANAADGLGGNGHRNERDHHPRGDDSNAAGHAAIISQREATSVKQRLSDGQIP
jgi:hypothetical protein